MRIVGVAAIVGCALSLIAVPHASYAVDPPNPNDPCSSAGRNTCGTLGVGYHREYRYGLRWFFRLREASAGDRVQVTTRNGRTFTYRVVSVARYLKSRLPTSVYSSAGRPRLVLVTCGGPFETGTGRYRDNIVVTAVPA